MDPQTPTQPIRFVEPGAPTKPVMSKPKVVRRLFS